MTTTNLHYDVTGVQDAIRERLEELTADVFLSDNPAADLGDGWYIDITDDPTEFVLAAPDGPTDLSVTVTRPWAVPIITSDGELQDPRYASIGSWRFPDRDATTTTKWGLMIAVVGEYMAVLDRWIDEYLPEMRLALIAERDALRARDEAYDAKCRDRVAILEPHVGETVRVTYAQGEQVTGVFTATNDTDIRIRNRESINRYGRHGVAAREGSDLAFNHGVGPIVAFEVKQPNGRYAPIAGFDGGVIR